MAIKKDENTITYAWSRWVQKMVFMGYAPTTTCKGYAMREQDRGRNNPCKEDNERVYLQDCIEYAHNSTKAKKEYRKKYTD